MNEVGRAMYRLAHGIPQPLRYERWFPPSYFAKAGFRMKPQRPSALEREFSAAVKRMWWLRD